MTAVRGTVREWHKFGWADLDGTGETIFLHPSMFPAGAAAPHEGDRVELTGIHHTGHRERRATTARVLPAGTGPIVVRWCAESSPTIARRRDALAKRRALLRRVS